MTSAERVTEFAITKTTWENGRAVKEEPATIAALIHALNLHCGALAEEYNFCIAPSIEYPARKDKDPETREYWQDPPDLIPRHRWLVAFGIEGGSEGYYVHVGAITSPRPHKTNDPSTYVDFGFAKTYSAESCYQLTREAQRFLTAAAWN